MRKLLIGVIVTLFLTFPVARIGAGQNRIDFRGERKTLKARQKRERRVLKSQQKNQKRSWKNAHLTKANRAQLKHQLKREARALRQQQKNDLQDLKDRQRLTKERMRQVH
jgi:alanyl-tRNA synthetase